MIKISIVIPMYNVAQYLEKCISSVYDQGLSEETFEVILVDDESPDNSLEVAKKMTFDKNNVKIISQKNKGLGGARNTGIENASGEYLLFLDSDDWLLPNVLEDLYVSAKKNDLDILEFAAQGKNIEGKILYHKSNSSKVFLSGFEYYHRVRYMHSACNKLYRRTFLNKNEILFLEKIYIEDFEFNTRCLTKAKRIKATDKLVSCFLQSENSITRNVNESKKQKMISDIIFVIKTVDSLYKKDSNDKESSFFYLERLNFLVATLFYQLVKNKASYKEVNKLKAKLLKDKVFYANHKIHDSKKNIFRILLVKNIWTYKVFRILVK